MEVRALARTELKLRAQSLGNCFLIRLGALIDGEWGGVGLGDSLLATSRRRGRGCWLAGSLGLLAPDGTGDDSTVDVVVDVAPVPEGRLVCVAE